MRVDPTIVPKHVAPEIRAACARLTSEFSPVVVSVEPEPGGLLTKCTENVRRSIGRHGGDAVFGWAVYLWPRVLVHFIGHVVIHRAGRLVCVTPQRERVDQILFLQDPAVTYDFSDPMARLGSVEIPLSPNPDVSEFIRIGAVIRDLKIKYPKTSENIVMVGADAISMRALGIEQTELLSPDSPQVPAS